MRQPLHAAIWRTCKNLQEIIRSAVGKGRNFGVKSRNSLSYMDKFPCVTAIAVETKNCKTGVPLAYSGGGATA
ncbi:hypothetical protein U4960_04750 [Altererythrobacter sp. H2]|uniref:hypothetical protein n=1 Tax=Altererythrobacter sp. H2 TaxID=3108391 RepID=UPI002B4BE4F7|nr:hypothetical protein [Altererythrobacter sp. H2]WRK96636.1 hypothetical protein U4960_04750 [Altererythrobacter sp. H2]